MDVKTEADEVSDCSHDDQPSSGMLGLLICCLCINLAHPAAMICQLHFLLLF